jgi:hypothetical protein
MAAAATAAEREALFMAMILCKTPASRQRRKWMNHFGNEEKNELPS